MIARKRLQLHVQPEAQADLNDMRDRSPEALGYALSAIMTALSRPQGLEKKGGHLVGHWSVSFPYGKDDTKHTGRVVVKLEDNALVVLAVDEDHDRAYQKAKARRQQ